jgi:hypothetical protein
LWSAQRHAIVRLGGLMETTTASVVCLLSHGLDVSDSHGTHFGAFSDPFSGFLPLTRLRDVLFARHVVVLELNAQEDDVRRLLQQARPQCGILQLCFGADMPFFELVPLGRARANEDREGVWADALPSVRTTGEMLVRIMSQASPDILPWTTAYVAIARPEWIPACVGCA